MSKTSVESSITYYVTVNTLNNETLTGYLSVPKAKGKYPVYITVPGAGPAASG